MSLRQIIAGIVCGAVLKLGYELYRFRSWDSLEAEVESWKESPKGRFHAHLDGLDESL